MNPRGRRARLFLKYFAFIGLLVSWQRVYAGVGARVVAEATGALALKGIQAPVTAYGIVSMKPSEERACER